MSIKNIIEKSDSRAGKVFDLSIQFLIVYSLVTFSLSTIPDLSQGMLDFLYYSQVITVAIFSIEYLLRIYVADNKSRYIFSFYGLIDLLAILPFYLTIAVDLRALRIVRLLHLFRLLKIVRYSKAIKRFKFAFLDIKEELVLFFTATCFMIYISAVGIYYFENSVQPEAFKSIFHSLWWGVATLTTVGYGDIYPITVGGKIFTFIILMIGLSVVAVPAGLFSIALQEANRRIDK
jgi:voltage-gated potassium channel